MAWRVSNRTPDEADIDIFDVIGDPWDGTTAADFVKELRGLTAQRINLHINSPGGYVSDGLAMYAAIQQHPAQITAIIESQAASAASFVAMAADHVAIFKNAQIMIHDAHGFAIGNAKDMRALADMLDEESNNIASIYADKAGGSTESWREAMQANEGMGSTYRGQGAVDAGLADELMDAKKMPMKPASSSTTFGITNQGEPTIDLSDADLAAIKEAATPKKPEPSVESLLRKHPIKLAGGKE